MNKLHPTPVLPMHRPDLSVLSNPSFWRIADAPFLAKSPIGDWDYETCKDFVAAAVRDDAPPSEDLVAANARLVMWEAQLGISEVLSFPYTVAFPLTDVCNARCAFCAYIPERVIGRSTGIREFEQLDWLKFVSSLNLNCGLGEPLIHPDFAEILAFLRRIAPHLRMSLISNASKLTPKSVDAMVGYLGYLKASINATRKETYERTMKISWDDTITGLKRLRDRKEELGSVLPRVRLSFVLHRENLDEILEAPALAKDVGAQSLNLFNMVPVQQRWSDRYDRLMTSDDVIENDYEHSLSVMRQFKQECVRHGISIFGNVPLVDDVTSDNDPDSMADLSLAERKQMMRGAILKRSLHDFASMSEGEMSEMHGLSAEAEGHAEAVATSTGFVRQVSVGFEPTCIDPWKNLRVGIRNEVTPCCMFFGGLPKFSWKHATARTFHDPDGMWNSPPMQALRSGMNRPPEEMPFCTGCRTSHKQDPAERGRFRELKLQSLARMDEAYEARFNGDIEQTTDLTHITLGDLGAPSTEHHAATRPFRQGVPTMRRRIDGLGMRGHGRVAYLGKDVGLATFLAEANGSLVTIGQPDDALVGNAAERFKLRNVEHLNADQLGALPPKDIDAILIDGMALARRDRTVALTAIAAALKSGGWFAMTHYPGPAKALLDAARFVAAMKPAKDLGQTQRVAERLRASIEGPIDPLTDRLLARCQDQMLLASAAACNAMQALAAGPKGHAAPNFGATAMLRQMLLAFRLRIRDDWFSTVPLTETPNPSAEPNDRDLPDWTAFATRIAEEADIAAGIATQREKYLGGQEFTIGARGFKR